MNRSVFVVALVVFSACVYAIEEDFVEVKSLDSADKAVGEGLGSVFKWNPPPAGSIIALKGGKNNHSKFCADEGNQIKCNRNALQQWEKFKVEDGGSGKIALKGGKNSHSKFCADEGNQIKCNRNAMAQWEKFTVEEVSYGGGRRIALKGGKNGKYCADEENNTKCNRNALQQWEKFKVKCVSGPCRAMAPGSVFALRGGKDTNNKYCADEGNTVKCNRNALQQWEKFTVENAGNGKIALKGGKDGKYCADEGNNSVKCNRNALQQWEKFTVVTMNNGKFALKGGKDGKYCADEGNQIKCNRNALQQWEKFNSECVSGTCARL